MHYKLIVAAAACLLSLSVLGAEHKFILPDGYDVAKSPPFSSAVEAGGAFYVSGTLGLDPSGQAPADAEAEAHLVLDAVKATLLKAGLTMDDLVSVTIYCTDLSLYDKFNAVYRGYFHEHFPARAFIGSSQLLRKAHFEIQGIAVKGGKPAKS